MASKSKSVVVELSDAQPKKSVTRFNASDENSAIQNVYVSHDALKKIGNPDSITVTIEAA
jgi:hypothetical protein